MDAYYSSSRKGEYLECFHYCGEHFLITRYERESGDVCAKNNNTLYAINYGFFFFILTKGMVKVLALFWQTTRGNFPPFLEDEPSRYYVSIRGEEKTLYSTI